MIQSAKNLLIAGLLLASGSLRAQPGRAPAVRSPEVMPDGKVIFRLRAPNAKQVAVAGIGERILMQKDEQGVWSATTGTLQPDLYTYSFFVDGVRLNDPGNKSVQILIDSLGPSILRVPGPAPWNPRNGPHGMVAHHFYHSSLIGDDRDYFVYTPPGYD